MNNKLMQVRFLWDNFGPLHADRCNAAAQEFQQCEVVGVELYSNSEIYGWDAEAGAKFRKTTLFSEGHPRRLKLLWALLRLRRIEGHGVWFLCHYDWPEILLFAFWLRLHGDMVFTMGCSKFDDMSRSAFRECLKSLFLTPYQGAIGSGIRSREYFRFLGVPANKVVGEYNTVSLARIQRLAGSPPAPKGMPFGERHFTIVARLVPKKNLVMALKAYSLYSKADPRPRALHLCGSGPVEDELRELSVKLDVSDNVFFRGFIQTDAVAHVLSTSLALLLPSTEEQFGNVVIEAQAMGLPVALSDNCGARDRLVRSGINGFVVEPDNPEGLAWFMGQLAKDESMWRRMCNCASEFAVRSDVAVFAKGALQLVTLKNG